MKKLKWTVVLEKYGRNYGKQITSIEELVLEIITRERMLLDVNYLLRRLQNEFGGMFPEEEEEKYRQACEGLDILCQNALVEKLEKRCNDGGIRTARKKILEALNSFYGVPVSEFFITEDNKLNREMVDNLLSRLKEERFLG